MVKAWENHSLTALTSVTADRRKGIRNEQAASRRRVSMRGVKAASVSAATVLIAHDSTGQSCCTVKKSSSRTACLKLAIITIWMTFDITVVHEADQGSVTVILKLLSRAFQ